MHRAALLAACALALCLAAAVGAATASAADEQVSTGVQVDPRNGLPALDPLTPRLYRVSSRTGFPPGFRLNARGAIKLGESLPAVKEARRKHPDLAPTPYLSPLGVPQGGFWHWDIFWRSDGKNIVEVEVGPFGGVLVVTEGVDIGWPLLRGDSGVIGGKLNAPWIWLPLCALFLLPFFDPRRPLRMLHIDLLMLLAFGMSQVFFTRGEPDVSVPLVYPPLIYFAIRGAWLGFRPRRRTGSLVPLLSTRLLIIGTVGLLTLRIAFCIAESSTFDIGTAGAIGADRVTHGLPLYQDNDAHGDTYGPVNYLMYVPAELAFPYQPGDDAAPIAATLMFDVLMIAGLFLLGQRMRAGPAGTRLGAALAWAWAAFPYSALILAANTNDALVPLFGVFALIALASPPGRGLLAGLGAMAKFAPALIAPALIAGRGPWRSRQTLIAGSAFTAVCAGLIVLFLPDGGLREFWNTTFGFQLDRHSPLAIWDREPGLDWLKPLFTAAAIALAAAAAFFPRRRTTGQVAALCAGILAAAQISGNYWLYFYVAWFAPFLWLGLFEEFGRVGPEPQVSVTSSFEKPEMISQPSSVTATRSSIRTPS